MSDSGISTSINLVKWLTPCSLLAHISGFMSCAPGHRRPLRVRGVVTLIPVRHLGLGKLGVVWSQDAWAMLGKCRTFACAHCALRSEFVRTFGNLSRLESSTCTLHKLDTSSPCWDYMPFFFFQIIVSLPGLAPWWSYFTTVSTGEWVSIRGGVLNSAWARTDSASSRAGYMHMGAGTLRAHSASLLSCCPLGKILQRWTLPCLSIFDYVIMAENIQAVIAWVFDGSSLSTKVRSGRNM
jgi:hypothetical protein